MCKFLSIVEDRQGNIYYHNWSDRKRLTHLGRDSHDTLMLSNLPKSINDCNKYEYNPWSDTLEVDGLCFKSPIKSVLDKIHKICLEDVCPLIKFEQKLQWPEVNTVTAKDKKMLQDLITIYDVKNGIHTMYTERYHTSVYRLLDYYPETSARTCSAVVEIFEIWSEWLLDDMSDLWCSTTKFIISKYPLSVVQGVNWRLFNRDNISEALQSKLHYLDMNNNPFYAVNYFYHRALFPIIRPDEVILRNRCGEDVFSVPLGKRSLNV